MRTTINGQPADWPESVREIWDAFDLPEDEVIAANWYTARPAVDEYNRGSKKEGFTYSRGDPDRPWDRRVFYVERIVPMPTAPYVEPRGDWA